MYLGIIFFLIGFFFSIFSNILIYMFCQNNFSLKNALKNINLIFYSKNIVFLLFFSAICGFFYYYIYSFSNNLLNTIIYCALFSSLLIISFVDLKIYIIPDSINIFIFILALIYIFFNKLNILYHIIGFFLISLPFLIIAVLTEGIGGGDVKLFAVCGLFLGGAHIFLAMFLSCILASIFGIILKFLNKAKIENNKLAIPLAPYISIGVIISMLFGNYILDWYFQKFLYNL